MSSKESLFNITSYTNSNPRIAIMDGVFDAVATHGIPLEIILSRFQESDYMPDWIAFYRKAINEGWKHDRIILKLEEAIGDVYGPEFKAEWRKRMDDVLSAILVKN